MAYMEATPPDFEDDFSTVNEAWSHVLFDNSRPDENLADYIQDGVFGVKRTGAEDWGEIGLGDLEGNTPLVGTDFALQVDATAVELGENGWFVIYYRAINSNMHNFFAINGDGNWTIVTRNEQEIVGGQTNLFELGESNQIQLLAQGENVAIYINGELVTLFQDSQVMGEYGQFSFGSEQEPFQGSVDNVKFWNLENDPQEPTPIMEPGEKNQITVASIQEFIASYPPNFTDDFSTEKPEWEIYTAVINSGTLQMATKNDIDVWARGEHLRASDFVIQYDLMIEGGDSTAAIFQIRNGLLTFELKDTGDWWLEVGDGKYLNGTANSYLPGEWNQLIIHVNGDNFEFYLNDELFKAFNETVSGDKNYLQTDSIDQGTVFIDNLNFWNLDGIEIIVEEEASEPALNPAVQTALDAIQNEAPIYKTNFDSWDFEDLPEFARIEAGKLVVTSEVDHVHVDSAALSSDWFAVEFEFRVLESSLDGHCIFYAENNNSEEAQRYIATVIHNSGVMILEVEVQQKLQEYVTLGTFDVSKSNKFTLFVLGDLIAGFINGQLAYTFVDPRVSAVYSHTAFAATNTIACEYDNYKVWDLSGVKSEEQEATAVFYEPILAYIESADTTFEDDFSTSKSEWGANSYRSSVDSMRSNGALVVIKSDADLTFPTNGLFKATDFAVAFDFTPDYSAGSGRFGLVFRSSDETGAYYNFNISYSDIAIVDSWLFSESDGTTVRTTEISSVNLKKDDDNHILIIARQEYLAIFVNNQLLHEDSDLASWGDEIYFINSGPNNANAELDNVKFWDLDGVEIGTQGETPETTGFSAAALVYIESEIPTFEDDFSTADLSVWGLTSEIIRIDDELVYGGKLTVTDHHEQPGGGVPNDHAVPGLTFPTNGLFQAENFALQFDFSFLTTNPVNKIGVQFRSPYNQNTGYSINFSQTGSWALTQNDGATAISNGRSTLNYRYNALLLIVRGQYLTVVLNDEIIYEANDLDSFGTFTEITILGGSHGTEGEFDNVKFWNLDGVDFNQ